MTNKWCPQNQKWTYFSEYQKGINADWRVLHFGGFCFTSYFLRATKIHQFTHIPCYFPPCSLKCFLFTVSHWFAVLIQVTRGLGQAGLGSCAPFRTLFPSLRFPFPCRHSSFSSARNPLSIRQLGSLLGPIWAQTRPFVELLYSHLTNYRIQSRMSELITCIYALQCLEKCNAAACLP